MSTTMINRFVQWLHETPKGFIQWLGLTLGVAATDFAIAITSMWTFIVFGYVAAFAEKSMFSVTIGGPHWFQSLLKVLPTSVLFETTIFQLLPLTPAVLLVRRGAPWAHAVILGTLFASSVLFGFWHGGWWLREVHMGFAGVLYGIAFLKGGGVCGTWRGIAAGWCTSALAHTLSNWAIIHYVAWL